MTIEPHTDNPHQLQAGDWVAYHVDAHVSFYGEILARDEENSSRWMVDVYGINADKSPDTVSLDQARLTFIGPCPPDGVQETAGGSEQAS